MVRRKEMLLQEERELIVEYGKQMSAQGLSKGTSGNISIYDKESDLMLRVTENHLVSGGCMQLSTKKNQEQVRLFIHILHFVQHLHV